MLLQDMEKVYTTEDKSISTPRKKMPIIRKPGEIVFPKHMRPTSIVSTVSLQVECDQQNVAEQEITVLHLSEVKPEINIQGHSILDKLCEQLDRVENKLDLAIATLHQHEASMRTLKRNVKDIRNEVRNRTRTPAPGTTVTEDKSYQKRRREALVIFPVADDSALQQLEDGVKTNEVMRNELIDLFNEAPSVGTYEYLRRNVQCLFLNTAKYTWTGKQGNNSPSLPPSNPACELRSIEILIECCLQRFRNSQKFVGKELRRALQNFNENMVLRIKRQQEKMMKNCGASKSRSSE
ncbi:uncharacterized protein LOC128743946 [Sabethes cyaneus]|uniref:uncharacterized protein LOC128743946 n=1 Tax=Sabethes cyaneus TaxID=53552 RepID=UPI00237DF03F|nr:uncharacterized protein LOC128743946 [Sabethes cyaneus]